MKKKIVKESLRFRINLWYTILICVLSVILISFITVTVRTAEKAEAQQNLIGSVERNIDEIEVESGILDIESDFAYVSGNVYVLVFGADGRLLGGSYPDGITIDEPLEMGSIKVIDDYYVYDSCIEFVKYDYKINGITGKIISAECEGVDSFTPYSGELDVKGEDYELSYQQAVDVAFLGSSVNSSTAQLINIRAYNDNEIPMYEVEFYSPEKAYEDVWVRGVVNADDFNGVWRVLAKIAAVLVLLIVVLAVAVGDIIAKKAMLPVKQLSEAISETRSGNDLTKRIAVSDSDPALVKLTEEFNAMLERLGVFFEMETQFTSDVSHELRTPTAVILAECEYQLSRSELDKEDRESIEIIKKQADSMKQIISQLLYFSRIERGKEKPDFQKEDLSELVDSVCDDLAFLTDKNISIEKDIDSGIEMRLDIAMITRLVTNLITNAVTYGKENGKILVSLKKNEDAIILKVADDGIGIAPEHIEKIWQRFYRVDKSRSREQGCSGLGLPMVKQMASLHGGEAWAESELGKGSIFTVEFRMND